MTEFSTKNIYEINLVPKIFMKISSCPLWKAVWKSQMTFCLHSKNQNDIKCISYKNKDKNEFNKVWIII